MRTIYLVSTGDYSDYHPLCAFTHWLTAARYAYRRNARQFRYWLEHEYPRLADERYVYWTAASSRPLRATYHDWARYQRGATYYVETLQLWDDLPVADAGR